MTALPFSPSCVIFTEPSVSNTMSLIASPAKKIVCRRVNFVGCAADTMIAQSARGIPANNWDSSAYWVPWRATTFISEPFCGNCKFDVSDATGAFAIIFSVVRISIGLRVLAAGVGP